MFYDLLVILTVIGCGWLGSRLGPLAAASVALELLACGLAAVVLHEPAIAAVDAGLRAVVGDLVGESWLYVTVFAALAWGGFAGLRKMMHREGLLPTEERDDPPLERIAGAMAGGIAGVVLAGVALVNLSMLPILSAFKPAPQRMLCDAGSLILGSAAAFAGDRHDGRSLPVDGEPPSRESSMSARLSGEPWADVDGDGLGGTADRYSDVDGNGSLTKDLYYVDLDGDQARRVGFLDKYRAGCWDYTLIHEDRERPQPKKPQAVVVRPVEKPPVPVEPAPTTPVAPAPQQAPVLPTAPATVPSAPPATSGPSPSPETPAAPSGEK